MHRVLIIDDTHAWNKLVGWHLASCGFKVESASCCEEALFKLRGMRPDCILMDFHFTDGSAVSLCAALRREGGQPPPPVIILSADPHAETLALKDCLAQRFILKDRNTFSLLPSLIAEVIRERDSGNEPEAGTK